MNQRSVKFRLRWKGKVVGYEKFFPGAGRGFLAGQWAYSTKLDTLWVSKPIKHNEKDQFTGFRDKNGKDIFEGDIIRWWEWKMNPDIYREHKNLYEMVWNDRNAKFELYSPEEAWGQDSDVGIEVFGEIDPETHQYEVIGNIYQNPELLKP